jgi:hypothetical protein
VLINGSKRSGSSKTSLVGHSGARLDPFRSKFGVRRRGVLRCAKDGPHQE